MAGKSLAGLDRETQSVMRLYLRHELEGLVENVYRPLAAKYPALAGKLGGLESQDLLSELIKMELFLPVIDTFLGPAAIRSKFSGALADYLVENRKQIYASYSQSYPVVRAGFISVCSGIMGLAKQSGKSPAEIVASESLLKTAVTCSVSAEDLKAVNEKMEFIADLALNLAGGYSGVDQGMAQDFHKQFERYQRQKWASLYGK